MLTFKTAKPCPSAPLRGTKSRLHGEGNHYWGGGNVHIVHTTGVPVSALRRLKQLHAGDNWVQLAFPQTGTLTIRQGDRRIDVGPGQMASVTNGAKFTISASRETRTLLIIVAGDSLSSRGISLDDLTTAQWADGPLVPALTVLMEETLEGAGNPDPSQVECALLESVVGLLASCSSERGGRQALRKQLIGLISTHFQDPGLDADWLAKQLGVSLRSLYDLVGEGDKSIATMVRERRMALGRQILSTQPNLSLRRVSRLCGFRGPDQFARAFKAANRVTPSDYRKSRAAPTLAS